MGSLFTGFRAVLSLFLLLTVLVNASPVAVKRQDAVLSTILKAATQFINGIQTTILDQIDDIIPIPTGQYTITQNSDDPSVRSAGVATKRSTFTYGPPVAGGPSFPSGELGTLRVALDQAFIQEDLVPELALAVADAAAAFLGLPKVLHYQSHGLCYIHLIDI